MHEITKLTELLDAVRAGQIKAVWLDNDCISGKSGDVDQAAPPSVRFESDPQKLLEECLSLLQIPWEHV